MFNSNNGYSLADIAAVTGAAGNNGSGFGWGGDGAWWLIVLFLFAFAGWGGNGFGGNYGGGGGAMPYLMSSATQTDVQRGFDQSAIISSLNGITSSVSNGFANAEVSRCNA